MLLLLAELEAVPLIYLGVLSRKLWERSTVTLLAVFSLHVSSYNTLLKASVLSLILYFDLLVSGVELEVTLMLWLLDTPADDLLPKRLPRSEELFADFNKVFERINLKAWRILRFSLRSVQDSNWKENMNH